MSIADKLTTIAENVHKVYEAGKQAGTDEFWGAYQGYGNRADCRYMFSGTYWNSYTFKPQHKIRPIDGSYMFYICGYNADLAQVLDDLGVSLDLSRCTAYNAMFYSSKFTRLPKILDKFTSNAISIFNGCTNLATIDEIELEKDITNDSHYRDAFTGCTALENIRFTGEGKLAANISFESCTKLTKESLISINNALSPTVIGKAVTYSKAAVNAAFGVDVDSETGGQENPEFLAWLSERPDWGRYYV